MIRLLLLACALHGKILFQDLPRQQVCVKGLSWAREFAVTQACSETVQIRAIHGVTRRDKGEPRLWLDNLLLGPLRQEHDGSGWESAEPVAFSPGKHSLSIECGAEAFEIESVIVGSGEPKTTPRPHVASPVPRSLAEPTPKPMSAACPDLKPNTQWLPGRPSKSLWLSVLNGREVKTPLLTRLKRGEKLRWWFYVHPRDTKKGLRYPPIVLECRRGDDGIWILAFAIDYDEMRKEAGRKHKDTEPTPLGYREGKWSSLDLALCPDGQLHLDLNHGEVLGEFSVPDAEMPLLIQTREIEFEIKGENK